MVGCMGAPVARAACIGTHPSHWRQASRVFPVSLERDWLWLEREGWETVPPTTKLPWVQIKTQVKIRQSGYKSASSYVACGNPTHPKRVSLATLFGFVFISPVKHLSECKLLLSHTLLHGLCLPDARDYRRCNLPASQVSKPTNGLFQIALKKRPKLSSPAGI